MKTFWDSGFPNELIEASRLEGATEWQIFWRIGMPLMQTGLVNHALPDRAVGHPAGGIPFRQVSPITGYERV
jgi:hypothetical protein